MKYYTTHSIISIGKYAFQPILSDMGFRENLKAELLYSGMLVKELAAMAGLKKHTIDNYLSIRGRMPAADIAVRIARVLGVSVEYMVTGNETVENKGIVQLTPEIRQMTRTIAALRPDYRKIAISFIHTLKKHEDSQLLKCQAPNIFSILKTFENLPNIFNTLKILDRHQILC